jgi:DNA polymerase type B, organellar and viral
MRLDGVYDIECAEWDRFVCGALVGMNGQRLLTWKADELFEALLEQEGVWYAHAGGRYDVLWFIDICTRRGIPFTAMMRGASVLCAKIGKLELRDSYAIIPMALAKCAPMTGKRKKLELGIKCECGECPDKNSGYCALARPLSRDEKESVETYLWQDCDVLIETLQALGTVAERNDIDLTLTVGGSAWKTAQRWLDLPKCSHDVERYNSIREGYYGGRTECYRTHADFGYRYDIHSSYPAALSVVCLPVGPVRFAGPSGIRRAYTAGLDGIYTAKLIVPECNVPPLPVRAESRLIYPHGPIEGTWTGLSLRYAEECGAQIVAISKGYVWDKSEPILAPFAQKIWDLRAAAADLHSEEGDAFAAWYKWLANSLTGKCAQRPNHATLEFFPSVDGMPPELPDDYDQVAVRFNGVFATRERVSVDACAHVEWSATLTSYATRELHRQLSGAPRPLYCDTDSVYAMDTITRRVGPNLGEWGYEGEARDWRCPAPKVYRYFDPVKNKVIVRGKGLPGLDAKGFDEIVNGKAWSVARGVEGLKTSLRKRSETHDNSLFKRRELTRSLRPVAGWVGGRELLATGETRATTVARYDSMEARRARNEATRKPKRSESSA